MNVVDALQPAECILQLRELAPSIQVKDAVHPEADHRATVAESFEDAYAYAEALRAGTVPTSTC